MTTSQLGDSGVLSQLAAVDHDVLAAACRLRVVTQTQLERLLADVPGRTLRYRTNRLHRLKLLGRSRPYRERGSAPYHLWPTSRADALMRGRPTPRRGERRPPNPLFLTHAAALSELYVVLRTQAGAAGLTMTEFRREGEARERFTAAAGRQRAIAPDARITVSDDDDRLLVANVELDLGTMSHARLRAKVAGYLQHAQCASPAHERRFPPTLLFITTSEPRAERFRQWTHRLRTGPEWHDGARQLEVVVCAQALRLEGVLSERCWRPLQAGVDLQLKDLLRR